MAAENLAMYLNPGLYGHLNNPAIQGEAKDRAMCRWDGGVNDIKIALIQVVLPILIEEKCITTQTAPAPDTGK